MRNLLKQTLLVATLLLAASAAGAQWVTIPDTAFVSWLNNNGCDTCMNGNQMDTTCSAVLSKKIVYCPNKNIVDLTGIQYFDSLITLNCRLNDLTVLPPLPNSLQTLNCESNMLSTLPNLPAGLKSLACGSNLLNALPPLPPFLESLACNNMWPSLTQLPALPASLTALACYQNQLTSLPPLPSNLTWLECWQNQLTSLPPLPATLEHFWLGQNSITTLNSLPTGLTWFNCENNFQLSSLPALPPGLEILGCSNCQLTSLPPLPSSLQELHCNNNALTSIPSLPASLNTLNLKDNQLSVLPDLPDSLTGLNVASNPALACLPELKNIHFLWFTGTAITCLPNYGTVSNSIPPLASVPLCGLFNPSGCTAYWNLSGRAWSDANGNCTIDAGEAGLTYLKVLLDSAGTVIRQTTTGQGGHYSFEADTGNYTLIVDTTSLPLSLSCPPSGLQTSILTALDSTDFGLDFGFECKPGFDIGVKVVVADSGSLAPGKTIRVHAYAGDLSKQYGLTCASGVAGSVVIAVNGPVMYLGPAPGALTPSVAGNMLSYAIPDFGTVDPTTAFGIRVAVDTNAAQGSMLCLDVSVTLVAGDLDSTNNTLTHCMPIQASFDPNDKAVYPEGTIPITQEWLTYTLRFQNTGSASAEHVYLIDTLDADLDPLSFEWLAASHPMIAQLDGHVMQFSFPNINLPDSASDEPGSHGYVQYRVRYFYDNIPLIVIPNRAHIYFDFNPPVATNTVYDTVAFDCTNLMNASLSDTLVCPGDTVWAMNQPDIFPFPVTYQWTLDSVPIPYQGSIPVSSQDSGIHVVTLQASAGGCSVYTDNLFLVLPAPPVPVIAVSGDTLSASPAFSWQWFLNGNAIGGANMATWVISQNGFYSVLVTDSNGCGRMSDSVFVSPVGIAESVNDMFGLYPNPAGDVLYMAFPKPPAGGATVSLFDPQGRNVLAGIVKSGDAIQSFDVRQLENGVYLLRYDSEQESRITRKVILAH